MSMIVKAWFGHLNPSNCNGEYFPTKWASQASSPPRSGDVCLFYDQIQWLHFHMKGECWDMPDHWLPYHTQYPPPYTLYHFLFTILEEEKNVKLTGEHWNVPVPWPPLLCLSLSAAWTSSHEPTTISYHAVRHHSQLRSDISDPNLSKTIHTRSGIIKMW